jgi:hypothetical protein
MACLTTHVGLLRAVNLGSFNKVAMADLRALLTSLGLHDPRTLLQTQRRLRPPFSDSAQPFLLRQLPDRAYQEQ